jgi:hypothetical protein
MARIRKALVAGAGTAVSTFVAGFWTSGGDGDKLAALIGAALAAGIAFGWATYRTPNELNATDLRAQGATPPPNRL